MINQPMGYYDRTKSATYNLTPTDFENFSNRQIVAPQINRVDYNDALVENLNNQIQVYDQGLAYNKDGEWEIPFTLFRGARRPDTDQWARPNIINTRTIWRSGMYGADSNAVEYDRNLIQQGNAFSSGLSRHAGAAGNVLILGGWFWNNWNFDPVKTKINQAQTGYTGPKMGWEFIKQRFGQEQGALVQDLLVQEGWDPEESGQGARNVDAYMYAVQRRLRDISYRQWSQNKMKADFGRTGVIKDPASHDLKRFGLDFITNYEFAVDIATLPLLGGASRALLGTAARRAAAGQVAKSTARDLLKVQMAVDATNKASKATRFRGRPVRTNPKAIDPNSIRYSADGTVIEIRNMAGNQIVKGGVKVGSELEKQLIDSGLLRLEAITGTRSPVAGVSQRAAYRTGIFADRSGTVFSHLGTKFPFQRAQRFGSNVGAPRTRGPLVVPPTRQGVRARVSAGRFSGQGRKMKFKSMQRPPRVRPQAGASTTQQLDALANIDRAADTGRLGAVGGRMVTEGSRPMLIANADTAKALGRTRATLLTDYNQLTKGSLTRGLRFAGNTIDFLSLQQAGKGSAYAFSRLMKIAGAGATWGGVTGLSFTNAQMKDDILLADLIYGDGNHDVAYSTGTLLKNSLFFGGLGAVLGTALGGTLGGFYRNYLKDGAAKIAQMSGQDWFERWTRRALLYGDTEVLPTSIGAAEKIVDEDVALNTLGRMLDEIAGIGEGSALLSKALYHRYGVSIVDGLDFIYHIHDKLGGLKLNGDVVEELMMDWLKSQSRKPADAAEALARNKADAEARTEAARRGLAEETGEPWTAKPREWDRIEATTEQNAAANDLLGRMEKQAKQLNEMTAKGIKGEDFDKAAAAYRKLLEEFEKLNLPRRPQDLIPEVRFRDYDFAAGGEGGALIAQVIKRRENLNQAIIQNRPKAEIARLRDAWKESVDALDAKYPTLNAEGQAVPRVALEAELTIQFRDLDNPAKVTPEKKKEIMKLLTDALGGTAVAGDKAASLSWFDSLFNGTGRTTDLISTIATFGTGQRKLTMSNLAILRELAGLIDNSQEALISDIHNFGKVRSVFDAQRQAMRDTSRVQQLRVELEDSLGSEGYQAVNRIILDDYAQDSIRILSKEEFIERVRQRASISDPMESLKFRDILVDKSRMDNFYNLYKEYATSIDDYFTQYRRLGEETRLLPKKPDGEPYLPLMFADTMNPEHIARVGREAFELKAAEALDQGLMPTVEIAAIHGFEMDEVNGRIVGIKNIKEDSLFYVKGFSDKELSDAWYPFLRNITRDELDELETFILKQRAAQGFEPIEKEGLKELASRTVEARRNKTLPSVQVERNLNKTRERLQGRLAVDDLQNAANEVATLLRQSKAWQASDGNLAREAYIEALAYKEALKNQHGIEIVTPLGEAYKGRKETPWIIVDEIPNRKGKQDKPALVISVFKPEIRKNGVVIQRAEVTTSRNVDAKDIPFIRQPEKAEVILKEGETVVRRSDTGDTPTQYKVESLIEESGQPLRVKLEGLEEPVLARELNAIERADAFYNHENIIDNIRYNADSVIDPKNPSLDWFAVGMDGLEKFMEQATGKKISSSELGFGHPLSKDFSEEFASDGIFPYEILDVLNKDIHIKRVIALGYKYNIDMSEILKRKIHDVKKSMEGEVRQRVAAYKEATEPVPPLVRAGKVTDRLSREALENRIKRFETLSRLSNEDIDSVNGMALLYELTTGDEVVKGMTKDAKIRVKEEIEAQWTNYLKQKEAWDLISADNIISRIAEIKKEHVNANIQRIANGEKPQFSRDQIYAAINKEFGDELNIKIDPENATSVLSGSQRELLDVILNGNKPTKPVPDLPEAPKAVDELLPSTETPAGPASAAAERQIKDEIIKERYGLTDADLKGNKTHYRNKFDREVEHESFLDDLNKRRRLAEQKIKEFDELMDDPRAVDPEARAAYLLLVESEASLIKEIDRLITEELYIPKQAKALRTAEDYRDSLIAKIEKQTEVVDAVDQQSGLQLLIDSSLPPDWHNITTLKGLRDKRTATRRELNRLRREREEVIGKKNRSRSAAKKREHIATQTRLTKQLTPLETIDASATQIIETLSDPSRYYAAATDELFTKLQSVTERIAKLRADTVESPNVNRTIDTLQKDVLKLRRQRDDFTTLESLQDFRTKEELRLAELDFIEKLGKEEFETFNKFMDTKLENKRDGVKVTVQKPEIKGQIIVEDHIGERVVTARQLLDTIIEGLDEGTYVKFTDAENKELAKQVAEASKEVTRIFGLARQEGKGVAGNTTVGQFLQLSGNSYDRVLNQFIDAVERFANRKKIATDVAIPRETAEEAFNTILAMSTMSDRDIIAYTVRAIVNDDGSNKYVIPLGDDLMKRLDEIGADAFMQGIDDGTIKITEKNAATLSRFLVEFEAKEKNIFHYKMVKGEDGKFTRRRIKGGKKVKTSPDPLENNVPLQDLIYKAANQAREMHKRTQSKRRAVTVLDDNGNPINKFINPESLDTAVETAGPEISIGKVSGQYTGVKWDNPVAVALERERNEALTRVVREYFQEIPTPKNASKEIAELVAKENAKNRRLQDLYLTIKDASGQSEVTRKGFNIYEGDGRLNFSALAREMDRRGHTTVTGAGISADIVRSDFLKLQSIFRAELRALAGKDKLTLGMLNKNLAESIEALSKVNEDVFFFIRDVSSENVWKKDFYSMDPDVTPGSGFDRAKMFSDQYSEIADEIARSYTTTTVKNADGEVSRPIAMGVEERQRLVDDLQWLGKNYQREFTEDIETIMLYGKDAPRWLLAKRTEVVNALKDKESIVSAMTGPAADRFRRKGRVKGSGSPLEQSVQGATVFTSADVGTVAKLQIQLKVLDDTLNRLKKDPTMVMKVDPTETIKILATDTYSPDAAGGTLVKAKPFPFMNKDKILHPDFDSWVDFLKLLKTSDGVPVTKSSVPESLREGWQRLTYNLKREGMIKSEKGGWVLTDTGRDWVVRTGKNTRNGDTNVDAVSSKLFGKDDLGPDGLYQSQRDRLQFLDQQIKELEATFERRAPTEEELTRYHKSEAERDHIKAQAVDKDIIEATRLLDQTVILDSQIRAIRKGELDKINPKLHKEVSEMLKQLSDTEVQTGNFIIPPAKKDQALRAAYFELQAQERVLVLQRKRLTKKIRELAGKNKRKGKGRKASKTPMILKDLNNEIFGSGIAKKAPVDKAGVPLPKSALKLPGIFDGISSDRWNAHYRGFDSNKTTSQMVEDALRGDKTHYTPEALELFKGGMTAYEDVFTTWAQRINGEATGRRTGLEEAYRNPEGVPFGSIDDGGARVFDTKTVMQNEKFRELFETDIAKMVAHYARKKGAEIRAQQVLNEFFRNLNIGDRNADLLLQNMRWSDVFEMIRETIKNINNIRRSEGGGAILHADQVKALHDAVNIAEDSYLNMMGRPRFHAEGGGGGFESIGRLGNHLAQAMFGPGISTAVALVEIPASILFRTGDLGSLGRGLSVLASDIKNMNRLDMTDLEGTAFVLDNYLYSGLHRYDHLDRLDMEYTIGARVRRAFAAMSDPSMAATPGGRMVDRVDNVLAALAKLGTEGTALRQVILMGKNIAISKGKYAFVQNLDKLMLFSQRLDIDELNRLGNRAKNAKDFSTEYSDAQRKYILSVARDVGLDEALAFRFYRAGLAGNMKGDTLNGIIMDLLRAGKMNTETKTFSLTDMLRFTQGKEARKYGKYSEHIYSDTFDKLALFIEMHAHDLSPEQRGLSRFNVLDKHPIGRLFTFYLSYPVSFFMNYMKKNPSEMGTGAALAAVAGLMGLEMFHQQVRAILKGEDVDELSEKWAEHPYAMLFREASYAPILGMGHNLFRSIYNAPFNEIIGDRNYQPSIVSSVGLSALERAAGAVQDAATGNVVTKGTNANAKRGPRMIDYLATGGDLQDGEGGQAEASKIVELMYDVTLPTSAMWWQGLEAIANASFNPTQQDALIHEVASHLPWILSNPDLDTEALQELLNRAGMSRLSPAIQERIGYSRPTTEQARIMMKGDPLPAAPSHRKHRGRPYAVKPKGPLGNLVDMPSSITPPTSLLP